MTQPVTISIVVPLGHQTHLAATLRSLIDQQYPALEIIIQDGDSKGGAFAVAEEFQKAYPRLIGISAGPGSGPAETLNLGFLHSNGAILGYLNPGDTLLPHTLHRVAREIDPSRGRVVVMGRCLFSGDGLLSPLVEHPVRYVDRFRLLAIWKLGYSEMPQPSVFWHRQAWEKAGGFDTALHHAYAYDLFCRITRQHRPVVIDDCLSTLRIEEDSWHSGASDADVLDESIRASRAHWGPWFSPLRWRCAFSYWLYSMQLHESARHHARRAEAALKEGRILAACMEACRTAMFSPCMAWKRLFGRWFVAGARRLIHRRSSIRP